MENQVVIDKQTSEQKMITALFIFSFILIAFLVAGGYFVNKRINKLKETVALYEVAQKELTTTKNKLKQSVSTVEVLTAENTSLFTTLGIKDENINRLQSIVKTYEKKVGDLNTALAISDETIMDLTDSLTNTIVGYTTHIDTTGCPVKYPIYQRVFVGKDNWYNGTVMMGLDTLDLHVMSRNAYDITIGDERVSLFKKKLFANVTNLNPNTETKVLKVYQKAEVKTKVGGFLLKNGTSIAIGVGVGYLLFK